MRLLVIVPRWMKGGEATRALAQNRARFPTARRVILAESSLENLAQDGEKLLILPPPNARGVWRQWLSAARDLRRRRFDKAVILLGARGEVGYGEAKFWALIANARRRAFGDEKLTLRREAQAKRHMASVLAARGLVALLDAIAPRGNVLYQSAAWRSARTFVYLRHAEHQYHLEPGRVLLSGAMWDEAAACRCGWQVSETAAPRLILCDARSNSHDCWDADLAPGGILVLCEARNAQVAPGWQISEERAPFFQHTNARDLWLRAAPERPT